MALTRKQFDILVSLEEDGSRSDEHSGARNAARSCLNLGMEDNVLHELESQGFVRKGRITSEGLSALEPYRVKRAVFIAAGFGSRMIPITLNTPKPLVRVHGVRIIDRLIDSCLAAGIQDIVIVRGYLAEQFDQLLYKYPMIRFLENPMYNEANNISSALVARNLLENAYVFEADLLISNPRLIQKYQYTSNFLGIQKERTDDWCFEVRGGIITEEKIGGLNCWQMVGISYWNETDGKKLSQDIADVYSAPGGKERYWEQVPLVYAKEHYAVEIRECYEEDIVEIDTYRELKAIDETYDTEGGTRA